MIRAPLRQRLVYRLDGGVRNSTQYAGTQFFLEAVHDRNHRDERGHTEGYTQHRGQGDKRNEVVASLGTQISQANKGFK